MDVKHCNGCYNNVYNDAMNIKQCWRLKTAKLVLRVAVHVGDQPPWIRKAERAPDCYRAERYLLVNPKHPSGKA
jgi:hypothetical protein